MLTRLSSIMKKMIKPLLFRLLGYNFFLHLQGIYWSRRLRGGKVCEREIEFLKDFIKTGDTVIDIGANCGQYTYHLSKLVGTCGKVLSVEPAKDTLEILKNVIKRLKLDNIEVENVALSDKDGTLEFVTPLDEQKLPNIGEAHLCGKADSPNWNRQKVQCTSLDKIISKFAPVDNVTFIKCDVEGSELMVLKGARKLLSTYHPVILCEIEERHTNRYDYSPEAVFSFLKDMGYRAFVLDSNKLLPVQGIKTCIRNYIFAPENFIIPMQYHRYNS